MPTLYSMVNEIGNRNRIFEICKFRISFRIVITPIILYRFSPNFACRWEIWSLRRLLFVRQTGSCLPILVMCIFRFWQYSGYGDHIFQQTSTNSHIHIKFNNADFVFNGECNRKWTTDFRDVQITHLDSALDRPAFDRTQLCLLEGLSNALDRQHAHVSVFASLARKCLLTPLNLGFRRIWPHKSIFAWWLVFEINSNFKVSLKSVKRFRRCGRSKFALSHCVSRWLTQQSIHTLRKSHGNRTHNVRACCSRIDHWLLPQLDHGPTGQV